MHACVLYVHMVMLYELLQLQQHCTYIVEMNNDIHSNKVKDDTDYFLKTLKLVRYSIINAHVSEATNIAL